MKQHLSPGLIGRIKGSVKNWLLPHPFKIVGQAMLLAILVALVIQILTTNVLANGDVTIDMLKVSIWQRAISIGLYLSMFLITCSREKVEDEMTLQERMRSLMIAFCTDIALFIISYICVLLPHGMPNFLVQTVSNNFAIFMIILPVVHLLRRWLSTRELKEEIIL